MDKWIDRSTDRPTNRPVRRFPVHGSTLRFHHYFSYTPLSIDIWTCPSMRLPNKSHQFLDWDFPWKSSDSLGYPQWKPPDPIDPIDPSASPGPPGGHREPGKLAATFFSKENHGKIRVNKCKTWENIEDIGQYYGKILYETNGKCWGQHLVSRTTRFPVRKVIRAVRIVCVFSRSVFAIREGSQLAHMECSLTSTKMLVIMKAMAIVTMILISNLRVTNKIPCI